MEELKAKRANIEEYVIKEIREGITMKADLEDSIRKPNNYISNSDTGIDHKVRTTTIGDSPTLWNARCGW